MFFPNLNIVITGPESSGKTWLSRSLSEHYETIWTPEFTRSYLKTIDRPYVEEDLLIIAKTQLEKQKSDLLLANRFLFSDTGLLVLKIWSEVKFGRCAPWIDRELKNGHYDLFLLCAPDLPWVYDPLRENPDDRALLFERYETTLKRFELPYAVITGEGEARLLNATQAVERFLLTPGISQY